MVYIQVVGSIKIGMGLCKKAIYYKCSGVTIYEDVKWRNKEKAIVQRCVDKQHDGESCDADADIWDTVRKTLQ